MWPTMQYEGSAVDFYGFIESTHLAVATGESLSMSVFINGRQSDVTVIRGRVYLCNSNEQMH